MKRLPCYLFVILFILYFTAYQGALSHVIYYHEQHHLFLFSQAYYYHSIHTAGLLSYVTDFLIQFFYIPALGSTLLAGILAGIYGFTSRIVSIFLGKRDILQLSLLPSIYLFFYTMQIDHSLTLVIGSFLAVLALYLVGCLLEKFSRLLPLFHFKYKISSKVTTWITAVCMLVYTFLGSYYFLTHYNRSERIMLKAEQYVKSKDWYKVVDYTKKYLDAGHYNQLIAYFYHLALARSGALSYHLLDYPQVQGVKGLYLPWNSDSRESEYGHFLYEELGYINEAQRWEFEAMVVWGETAPHLINLAKYNIVNHRPLVAQRFINKLKQSLFYRTTALELENCLHTGKVHGLRNALYKQQDIPARFANVLNIGPELQYLCEADSTNRMAYDYLMSHLLLSNHVVRFVDNLKQMSRFQIKKMPPVYEEALYIYKLGVSPEQFAAVGIDVSPGTEARFNRYYQLVQSKQLEALKQEFGNTYWFYLNYISPYGNKVLTN